MGAEELQQFAATLEPALRSNEHQLRKCVGWGETSFDGGLCCPGKQLMPCRCLHSSRAACRETNHPLVQLLLFAGRSATCR